MNKKAVTFSVIITMIIGLFVIGLVVMGPLRGAYEVVSEKIFGVKTPTAEGEFVPYVPQYTEEERQVIDSMNALTCAINSIAVGRFDPTDLRLCPKSETAPEEKPKEQKPAEEQRPPEVAPMAILTGFFYKITGLAEAEDKNVAKYGNVTVSCEGKRVEQMYLGSKDKNGNISSWQESFPEKFTGDAYAQMQAKDFAIKQVGDAILDCWKAIRPYSDKKSYYKCAILNSHPLLGKKETTNDDIYFSEDDILNYFRLLIQQNDPRKDIAETLISGNVIYGNRISISGKVQTKLGYGQTTDYCGEKPGVTTTSNICGRATIRRASEDIYCVYFDAGRTFATRDTIAVADCREFTAEDDFKCYVKSFELPQQIEKEGWYNPLAWVTGNNDPKYLIYYEAFPQGVDNFWHVDAVSVATVGLIIGTATFDLIPLVGKTGKIAASSLKAGVKETISTMGEQGFRAGMKQFFESIFKSGFKRTVQKELLKESLNDMGGGVGKRIAGEVADKTDEYVGGFLGLKKIRTKLSPEYHEELVSGLAKEIRKMDIKDITIDYDFYVKYLDDAAKAEGKKLGDLIDAEDILATIERETDPNMIFLYEKTLPRPRIELEHDAALIKQIKAKMAEAYSDKMSRDMAEAGIERFTTRATKEQLKAFSERNAVKNFLAGMFDEGFESLSPAAMQKSMNDAFKKFSSLSLLQRRKAATKGAELAQKYLTPEGFVDFAKLAGKPVDDATKVKLTGELLDAIASNAQSKTMARRMVEAEFKGLKLGTVGPGYISWVLDLVGIPRIYRVGKTAITEATPLSALTMKGEAKWVAKTGATTVGELAGWIKNHKYPIIAMLAFYGASKDAAYEKFNPVGVNSLGVDMPFLYTDPAPWQLVNETEGYFMAPVDSEGNIRNQRLYLVSPCKADLVVQKQTMECHRMPLGVQHYRFNDEDNPLDVKAGSVVLNEELLADDDFVFESYKRNFPDSLYLTEPEADVVKNAINHLKNKRDSERMPGAGNLYAKYPILIELDPDPLDHIKTRKQAAVALFRDLVVDFYDTQVNGIQLGAVNAQGVFTVSRVEEQAYQLSYETYWKRYQDFYDLSGIQKECFYREGGADFFETWKGVYTGISGQNVPIQENVLAHPAYRVNTVTVQVQNRIPGWNNGINYCMDEYSNLKYIRAGSLVGQIVLSVGATALASAVLTPAAGAVVAPLAMFTGSIGFGIAEEWAARQYKWPAVQGQAVGTDFPIAQSLSGEGNSLDELDTRYTAV